MSTQKGNTSRTRPQKHKNHTAFKNNLHDASNRTKIINAIQVSDVCIRCRDIIEWKIKYKKYKPLTQPKTCVKCSSKTVKQAYHVMCAQCGRKLGLCTKCSQKKEIVEIPAKSEIEEFKLDSEVNALLQPLTERKRRTFMRYIKKVNEKVKKGETTVEKDNLLLKLKDLSVEHDSEESDFNSDSGAS